MSHTRDGLEPELFQRLRLLVSELVTNSVRHAGLRPRDRIRLRIQPREDAVRVSVTDPGAGFFPRPRASQPGVPSGWGLYLVERLADRWGVKGDGTTCVWFELDR